MNCIWSESRTCKEVFSYIIIFKVYILVSRMYTNGQTATKANDRFGGWCYSSDTRARYSSVSSSIYANNILVRIQNQCVDEYTDEYRARGPRNQVQDSGVAVYSCILLTNRNAPSQFQRHHSVSCHWLNATEQRRISIATAKMDS